MNDAYRIRLSGQGCINKLIIISRVMYLIKLIRIMMAGHFCNLKLIFLKHLEYSKSHVMERCRGRQPQVNKIEMQIKLIYSIYLVYTVQVAVWSGVQAGSHTYKSEMQVQVAVWSGVEAGGHRYKREMQRKLHKHEPHIQDIWSGQGCKNQLIIISIEMYD